MTSFLYKKRKSTIQVFIGLLIISAIAIPSYLFSGIFGYRFVALLLLLALSILAMLFEIFPVIFLAVLSAIIWNYFFIPPVFNFHIGTSEDILMFLMYFVVALINAVLTFKIKQSERTARDKEQKEKTYTTLFNSLSHELRTPISTIICAIDTIKDNENKLNPQNKKELFDEIETAALRLNRQVENLLNINRLEGGFLKLKPDWCDINELIHLIINEHQEENETRKIIFNPGEKTTLVYTDRFLIEQVIHNVLHNALRYTPEFSIIQIETTVEKEFIFISISDNGQGFPENEIEKVFEKFYRLPNSITGGTGLGLSIAKGFTETLHGSILLKNLPSGGACFTIKIPAQLPNNKLINE